MNFPKRKKNIIPTLFILAIMSVSAFYLYNQFVDGRFSFGNVTNETEPPTYYYSGGSGGAIPSVTEETDPIWTANQSSYFNTTDILGFSYYNLTNSPIYLNDTFRGTNYTTFLTHITWANATNGTLMKQADWNTNYTANNDKWSSFTANYSVFLTHTTWANILNGTMLSQATYNTNYTNFYPQITSKINWTQAVNGTLMSQATYNTNYSTLAKLGAINTWTANQTLGNNYITNGTGGAYIRHNGTGWVIKG